ncbi:hypothetical protein WJX84_004519 [Apatococcus fuscideae]|uniref:Uncharacterized protein n=1 Tax=Apatococcus fuscideae TaxID=2026836 RepID=A0AAW1SJ93_9CHLO
MGHVPQSGRTLDPGTNTQYIYCPQTITRLRYRIVQNAQSTSSARGAKASGSYSSLTDYTEETVQIQKVELSQYGKGSARRGSGRCSSTCIGAVSTP